MTPARMDRRFILCAGAALATLPMGACATLGGAHSEADARATILARLESQRLAWNDGDIDAFMSVYWHDERLMFVSGDHVTYGYSATNQRYHAHYGNRALMGQLSFDILDLRIFQTQTPHAIMLGRWHQTRPDEGDVGGYFTLLWQKIDGQWVIIRDHTS